MFKKKRSPARTALNVFLIALLLIAIAFLGYSVGKPIMEFVSSRPSREANVSTGPTEPLEPATSPTTVSEKPVTTTEAPVSEEPEKELSRLYFVKLPYRDDSVFHQFFAK